MPVSKLSLVLLIVAGCLGSRAASGAEGEKKSAVPDAAAQTAALREVKSILAEDFAKSPKRQLAEKLLKYGKEEKENIAQRYVLFVEAGKASIAAGDATLICDSADALAAHFQGFDATTMKVT